jgi:hypothetical protein
MERQSNKRYETRFVLRAVEKLDGEDCAWKYALVAHTSMHNFTICFSGY